ncbi:hypothetical protein [Candidatus Similichlamydia laticola]|uniref:Uncharacterized protein n=1 Tax=Candidatus Similichlamydia laticola TaxID=2170265 RepID=A0A369KDF1_9BACT|nr:hypothetical protein [Candidatus Similichlamydia laticola]RDB31632.1 hypothetical protein HAT2_00243 [Candidatus Similichlamydia laticola]
MFRKLLGALFGVSAVQSPDAVQQSERTETVVHEEFIELQEGNNDSEIVILETEIEKTGEHSFSDSVDDSPCKRCPLHCHLVRERTHDHGPKCFRKDWLSEKLQCFKVQMAKLKGKLIRGFEKVKSDVNGFISQRRNGSDRQDSRPRNRSR